MIIPFFIYFVLITICCVFFAINKEKKVEKKFSDVKNAVIVAAKNEEKNIANLLDCLVNQTLKKLEIIIVDDNSTDNTVKIIKKYQEKYPQIKLFINNGHGKKNALNYAISKIDVDFVFQTDADCFLTPFWAENILNNALQNNSQMVLAPVILEVETKNKIFEYLWQAESLSLITITAGTCLMGFPIMSNGANIMYKFIDRKNANLNLKYSSGDDMFLLQDFYKNDKKISYCEKSPVFTSAPQNIKQLLKQRARWVGKSGGYTQFAVIFFALIVFAANFGLILSVFLLMFNFLSWQKVIFFYMLKTIPDIFSIIVPAIKFKIKINALSVFILSIIYPFYTLAVAIKAFLGKNSWK